MEAKIIAGVACVVPLISLTKGKKGLIVRTSGNSSMLKTLKIGKSREKKFRKDTIICIAKAEVLATFCLGSSRNHSSV